MAVSGRGAGQIQLTVWLGCPTPGLAWVWRRSNTKRIRSTTLWSRDIGRQCSGERQGQRGGGGGGGGGGEGGGRGGGGGAPPPTLVSSSPGSSSPASGAEPESDLFT